MDTIERELAKAVWDLPDEAAMPLLARLITGIFPLGSGNESERVIRSIPEMSDFVGWFDAYAERQGRDAAVEVVYLSLAAEFRPPRTC